MHTNEKVHVGDGRAYPYLKRRRPWEGCLSCRKRKACVVILLLVIASDIDSDQAPMMAGREGFIVARMLQRPYT